jgi:hypothetical protein
MMDEQELRVYALERAIVTEGPKAVASEVIDAAQAIYEFLTDTEASTSRELPN